MKKEEYQNSTAGRLVRTHIALTPYWAFLPNPLPPKIDANWKLVNLLSEADRELGTLAGLARNIPEPAILIEPLMRREAVLSSRIEGTRTVLSELYGYETGYILPGFSKSNETLLENQEVLNYVKSLKKGLELIVDQSVNLKMVCELHRILLYGVRGDEFPLGEFRETQNFIGKTNDPDDAVFIPTPVDELGSALKKFESYLVDGNQYPPLIRIAMIHYQFETLHPFLDGNGRLGRLLIALLLTAWNLIPQPLLYPSAYFERHREKYYETLLNVSRMGDWNSWLEFFLSMIIDQARDTIKRSNKMVELKEGWEEKLREMGASVHYYKIIDSFFITPFFSVSDMQKKLGVTNKAARAMMERLKNMGVLVLSEEKKYGRIYEAADLIRILQEH